jgi:hypothetical protein
MIKVALLIYNLLMFTVACYFVYYKDASAWLFLMVLLLAATWRTSNDQNEKPSSNS